MKLIWMHVFANIRKNKGYSIITWLMTGIAALLLSVGFLSAFQFGNYVEELGRELKTSDVYYAIPKGSYDQDVEEYLEQNQEVAGWWQEEALWLTRKVKWDAGERELAMVVFNADQERGASRWKYIGEHRERREDSIYLPYLFQVAGGYELDDTFELEIDDQKFVFTVSGFIEDMCFSSPDTMLMGLYLPEAGFQEMQERVESPENYTSLYFVNQKELNTDMERELREITGMTGASTSTGVTESLFSLDKQLIYSSRTMMPMLIAVLIIAFSLIISCVCVLVIRFRISVSVADDMERIGSLKAAGYTSRQIILSIVMQYGILAVTSAVAGIAASYRAVPVLSDILALQSGLKWEQEFSLPYALLTFAVLTGLVVMISLMAARKIRKISPVTAMRGGLLTHNFKKNYIPLETSRGPLQLQLAMKNMLQGRRQSFMIIVTVAVLGFASAFAIVMYYNAVVDTTAFAEVPGIEMSNLVAVRSPEGDADQFTEEILSYKQIEKVAYLDEIGVVVGNKTMYGYVMEDYDQKKTDTIYEGRYPQHDNETALSTVYCDQIGKKIGDMIQVSYGDTEKEYLITGLTQGANMEGMQIFFTIEGFSHLKEDFTPQNLQIYLHDGESAADFSERIEEDFGDTIIFTSDVDQMFEDYMGAYVAVVSAIGAAILAITVLIVILVLFFVVYGAVIRQKKQLGIQKALGVTTLQLMNQMSVSFLLPVAAGSILGGILGISQTNRIMSLIFYSMGVAEIHFILRPTEVMLFSLFLIVLAYVSALAITSQIRRISAYELTKE